MIRVQPAVLIASVALALAVPFAAATAQTNPNCWVQTDGATACVTGEIGTAGPVAGDFSSTTMLKAEMKQGIYDPGPAYTEPTRTAAVLAPPSTVTTMADQTCGPTNVAAITDEYGHKYNCRGDLLH